LFAILRGLLEAERVPFGATPLVGLQIMGMLETRLLSFRRVVIVDAGEDSLPGFPNADPLLPEALRPELGLPPLHSREQVAAYTFFRLVAGAEEIALFWQEGGEAPGIQEQKKGKSRFVEELLWEEEKNRGRLLASTGRDGPLTVLSSRVAPLPRSRAEIPLSPPVRKLLLDLRQRPLSASLLDSYLRCPVSFFHERLVRLAPAEDLVEGDDPLSIGNLFHQILREGYGTRLGQALPGGEELARDMESGLLRALFSSPAFLALSRKLPADSLSMLVCAAEKRLPEYLRAQPPTRVLGLESSLSAVFSHQGANWTLTGKLDRLDVRVFSDKGVLSPTAVRVFSDKGVFSATNAGVFSATDRGALASTDAPVVSRTEKETTEGKRGDMGGADAGQDLSPEEQAAGGVAGIVLLDYKTGRIPFVSRDLWEDRRLWKRMEQWQPGPCRAGEPDPLLAELSGRMESLQLPFYLLLYFLASAQGTLSPLEDGSASLALPPLDARWIDLGDTGREISLFPKNFSLEQRRQAVEQQIPSLLHFLLRHMLESPVFAPCPGKHCDWCFSAKLCTLSGAPTLPPAGAPPLQPPSAGES
jgi:hypothetical protein